MIRVPGKDDIDLDAKVASDILKDIEDFCRRRCGRRARSSGALARSLNSGGLRRTHRTKLSMADAHALRVSRIHEPILLAGVDAASGDKQHECCRPRRHCRPVVAIDARSFDHLPRKSGRAKSGWRVPANRVICARADQFLKEQRSSRCRGGLGQGFGSHSLRGVAKKSPP